MNKRPYKRNFFRRMFVSIITLVIITILLSGSIAAYTAISLKESELNDTISSVSAMISEIDEVKKSLKKGKASEEMIEELRYMTDTFSTVDVIAVCNTDGIRIYHTNPAQIGKHFVGNDEGPILEGSEPYISVAEGTLGPQRRAFNSVKDENGNIIGFVISSVLISHITAVRNAVILKYVFAFLILIPIALLISWIIIRQLKKILLGHAPEELANRYIEREDVLNALDEGIFAINPMGEIILMNKSAKKILNLNPEESQYGKILADIYPETKLPQTIATCTPEYNVRYTIAGQSILSSRIPVTDNNKVIGAVSIFRNRTEVDRLAEELTGTKYMVDTLRAFNHEYMNKLHVILGLLEINEISNAKEYILKTSMISGKAVSEISKKIPVSNLAALLIGKLISASELGITFTLKSDSYMKSKTHELPSDCFITIAGNLIQNAIDELTSKDYPVKSIEFGIYSDEGHTIICCDDTGGGIPDRILGSIYEKYVTTKGEGHGSGYPLIKETVDTYKGNISINTEIGLGTSVEIVLPI